jgi:hypothetical protein
MVINQIICSLALKPAKVPSLLQGETALPSQAPADTDWDFHEEYLAALQTLLRQFPDDFFVQRRYVAFMISHAPSDSEKVIGEYKARHSQHPDSPQLGYLYGYALLGHQSSESIKLFDAALEKDPQFFLPHLLLATIYNSPAFQDKTKSVAHLKAFLEACPTSFDGYGPLARMQDKDLINQFASKLRLLLQNRTDSDAIGAYQTLWSLEFQAHSPSEYDALRKQVAQDLERIRPLALQDKSVWYETLEKGYKLANDQKQSDWAEEQREVHFPSPWRITAREKWFEEHATDTDASPDKKRVFNRELLAQSGEWLKMRPNLTFLWWDRLYALAHLEDVSPVEIEMAADQGLKIAGKNGGPLGPSSYDYLTVAENLSKRHLQPARVVQLAQKGLARLEFELRESYLDLNTKEMLDESNRYFALQRIRALGFETDGHLQLKQAENAQIDLLQTDERLQDLKSLAGDKQEGKKTYSGELSAYWGRMARLAELRGRKLDAMAFYESALLTRLEAQQKPDTGEKDELADDAKGLWTSLGGTAEAWRIWYGRRADALSNASSLTWEDVNQPLASFDLADLTGKSWNLESLKGKVTFLNFWASW